jgi:hypothetical protein
MLPALAEWYQHKLRKTIDVITILILSMLSLSYKFLKPNKKLPLNPALGPLAHW